jgi:hypothetical protein
MIFKKKRKKSDFSDGYELPCRSSANNLNIGMGSKTGNITLSSIETINYYCQRIEIEDLVERVTSSTEIVSFFPNNHPNMKCVTSSTMTLKSFAILVKRVC